jgi:hypothetical protein
MSNLRFALQLAFVAMTLSACAPSTPFPPPIPSPAENWTIVLKQSGGFAGVSLTVRVESDGAMTATEARGGREVTKPVSHSDMRAVERVLDALILHGQGGERSTCADCFLYELQITNLGGTIEWRGDDTTLDESGAGELVRLLGRLRDEALSGAN